VTDATRGGKKKSTNCHPARVTRTLVGRYRVPTPIQLGETKGGKRSKDAKKIRCRGGMKKRKTSRGQTHGTDGVNGPRAQNGCAWGAAELGKKEGNNNRGGNSSRLQLEVGWAAPTAAEKAQFLGVSEHGQRKKKRRGTRAEVSKSRRQGFEDLGGTVSGTKGSAKKGSPRICRNKEEQRKKGCPCYANKGKKKRRTVV